MGRPSGSACSSTAPMPRELPANNSLLEMVRISTPSTRQFPALPIFAGQAPVGILRACNFPVFGVVEQPLARAQGDRIEVDGFGNRSRVQEASGRLSAAPAGGDPLPHAGRYPAGLALRAPRTRLRSRVPAHPPFGDQTGVLDTEACQDLALVPDEHHALGGKLP